MPLAPGTRLGSYDIVALIGAGGMGDIEGETLADRIQRGAIPVKAALFDDSARSGRMLSILSGGFQRTITSLGPPACFRTSASANIASCLSGTRVVDRDLALRKIATIDQYLVQLTEYRTVDPEFYRNDWKTQRIVERTLYLAIEACMDLADHLVADRRLPVPDTGAATFEIVADAGVISAEVGRSLARMVGFRNILVHDYARIDPSTVLGVLRTDIEDVARFRDIVLRELGD
jgi:uncharacterized protein YutE (UPF0331/DUF86 family)